MSLLQITDLHASVGDTPSSSVTAFPAPGQDATTIALTWSGQPGSGGLPIVSYDILYSDNGAAYTPLLQNVAGTTTTFTGAFGGSSRRRPS